MIDIKAFADAKMTEISHNNKSYSEWNLQCLTLHYIISQFFPTLARSTIDDDETFCIFHKEDNLGTSIDRRHPKILFSGDYKQ